MLADRVAVLSGGEIIEVSTPALLGGRDKAGARVTWRENSQLHTTETHTPSQLIAEISSRLGGEIPELSVTRPTLEDIYLAMIGDK